MAYQIVNKAVIALTLLVPVLAGKTAVSAEFVHTYSGTVESVNCLSGDCIDAPSIGTSVEIQIRYDGASVPDTSTATEACWIRVEDLVKSISVKVGARTLGGPVAVDPFPRKVSRRKCGASGVADVVVASFNDGAEFSVAAYFSDTSPGQSGRLNLWCEQLSAVLPISAFPFTLPTQCGFELDNVVVNFASEPPTYSNNYFYSGSIVSVTGAVPTLAEQVDSLAQVVVSMNLQAGIANSIDAKLDAVSAAFSDANRQDGPAVVNMLYAFINNVEAQRGKKLTNAQADQLRSLAEAIIASTQ